MPYALLQRSLDQTIDRESLEDAAATSHSIPRPDCAHLQKELFGIVVDNLDHDRALALQRELLGRNFPTDVVDQAQLPALNQPDSPGQSFQIKPQAFVAADLYGSEVEYPWDQFVFAAAGYILRLRERPFQTHVEQSQMSRKIAVVSEYQVQHVPEFRFDLFFAMEPYRLQWIWDSDSIIRVNQEPIRLREHDKLVLVLRQLVGFLPAERLNSGVRKLNDGKYFVYPSVHAFEEEIIWSFYQLMRSAGS